MWIKNTDHRQSLWLRHVIISCMLTVFVFAWQAPWLSYLTQRQLSSTESRQFVSLVQDRRKLCELIQKRVAAHPGDRIARQLLTTCNEREVNTGKGIDSLQQTNSDKMKSTQAPTHKLK